MKSKRNEEEFQAMKETLEILEKREEAGNLDLSYFDGAGFTLEPSVPYAWQEKGKTIEIPSEKSKRINVLGFFSKANEFCPYVFENSIDSDIVIACMDDFCKKIEKDTVVFLDRAPIHTSEKMELKWEEWCSKGLCVILLPAYSPELNKIEILWRKIKYEWLPFSAYQSYIHLKDSLMDILRNVGKKFRINFSATKC